MKILHYSLGFPPYRSGGLTKFCMDLMDEQARCGDEVSLLWPGQMRIFDKKIKIIQRKSQGNIRSFELINPLPVSYDEGIIDVDAYTASCDNSVYHNFLNQHSPDVIHIHTLMGLHIEFLTEARKLGIHTVFSVHDFFAVCSKVTLFHNNRVCESPEDCENCPACNASALSLKKLWVLQSLPYRVMKNSWVIKKLRKLHRDNYLEGAVEEKTNADASKEHKLSEPNMYIKLRNYYCDMVSDMDFVHYNSMVTKKVFEGFVSPNRSAIIPITHGNIIDKRKKKQFSEHLRISYLGPQGAAKGYFVLQEALDDLWQRNKNFELNVYFEPSRMSPYIRQHSRYDYNQLEQIMDETDVLIVPSVWKETFGYTVVEALSFGVPVIVSDNVGAKDIIPEGCGVIVENFDVRSLEKVIEDLSPEDLRSMNNAILNKYKPLSVEKMNQEIVEKCYEC